MGRFLSNFTAHPNPEGPTHTHPPTHLPTHPRTQIISFLISEL